VSSVLLLEFWIRYYNLASERSWLPQFNQCGSSKLPR